MSKHKNVHIFIEEIDDYNFQALMDVVTELKSYFTFSGNAADLEEDPDVWVPVVLEEFEDGYNSVIGRMKAPEEDDSVARMEIEIFEPSIVMQVMNKPPERLSIHIKDLYFNSERRFD